VSEFQTEIRWIIAMALFFVERDVIIDTMFALIDIVFSLL